MAATSVADTVIGDLTRAKPIVYGGPIYLGNVIQHDFRLKDEDDVVLSLAGSRWVFGLVDTADPSTLLIDLDTNDSTFDVLNDAEGDYAALRVSSAATAALTAGVVYRYDVQVTLADGKVLPIAYCRKLVFEEAAGVFD